MKLSIIVLGILFISIAYGLGWFFEKYLCKKSLFFRKLFGKYNEYQETINNLNIPKDWRRE